MAITAAGGGGVAGLVIGFLADPAKGIEVFRYFDASLGSIGMVFMFFNIVLIAAVWVLWTQRDRDEERWSKRFQELRSDTKEAFSMIGVAATQLTLIAERLGITKTQSPRP